MTVITPIDEGVCPDLVDHEVLGHFRSWVVARERLRYWDFEDREGEKVFLKEVEAGAFRRTRP